MRPRDSTEWTNPVRLSSHKDLALYDLVGRLAADHRFPGKYLSTVGTPQVSIRVVFNDSVLVTLDEMPRPCLVVFVKQEAAVHAINLDGMSLFLVSHNRAAQMTLRNLSIDLSGSRDIALFHAAPSCLPPACPSPACRQTGTQTGSGTGREESWVASPEFTRIFSESHRRERSIPDLPRLHNWRSYRICRPMLDHDL